MINSNFGIRRITERDMWAFVKERHRKTGQMNEEEHQDGKSWEDYVQQLLSIHFSQSGHVYQPVPDRTHGDNGLEGWVDGTGDAFQAYSGENCDTSRKLTNGQKKKITDDLNKLIKYAEFWTALFEKRGVVLRRWTLLVPKTVNKDVLQHATDRATELRKAGLPFISSDFVTHVHTPREYPMARACLRDPALAKTLLSVREPSAVDLSASQFSVPHFLENLDRKLSTLLPNATPQELSEQRMRYVRDHLRRENYLNDLGDAFPTHRDDLGNFLAIKADEIKTFEIMDEDLPKSRLRKVKDDIKSGIVQAAPFANDTQQVAIVQGTIAYWLGECSLGFAI